VARNPSLLNDRLLERWLTCRRRRCRRQEEKRRDSPNRSKSKNLITRDQDKVKGKVLIKVSINTSSNQFRILIRNEPSSEISISDNSMIQNYLSILS